MERILVMLEVSQKQEYIFASKKLRENVTRSAEIAQITGSRFFEAAAGLYYNETENLVYTGGGHAVLQFESEVQAVSFNKAVTEAVLRQYRGLELFAVKLPYDVTRTPGENLKNLTKALERKKAVRSAGFSQKDFGVESSLISSGSPNDSETVPQGYGGYHYPSLLEEVVGDDTFLAVIHLDGNAMGERLSRIYAENETWYGCRRALKDFSETVQRDFTASFHETVETVIRKVKIDPQTKLLPIRPILLAGDDVCFVTAGRIGLECARVFLERLSRRGWAACAGVAIVPWKYPFHLSYTLAEELCSNAKKFSYEQDSTSGISAMDWQLVTGNRLESLSAMRDRYEADDGISLTLRPVNVIARGKSSNVRSYDHFRETYRYLHRNLDAIGRPDLKDLRGVLRQGEVESRFFLHIHELTSLLEDRLFEEVHGETRCLCFDALEVMDRCVFFEEG